MLCGTRSKFLLGSGGPRSRSLAVFLLLSKQLDDLLGLLLKSVSLSLGLVLLGPKIGHLLLYVYKDKK